MTEDRGDSLGRSLARFCAFALPVFVLFEVNYPLLRPETQLAIFAGLGVALGFLSGGERESGPRRAVLRLLPALLFLGVAAYLVIESEPLFETLWAGGQSLGGRAGIETGLDIVIGALGLVLILEATRRGLGPALPILALLFLAYALFGSHLPAWLLPHRGYGLSRVVAQTFLQSQGVFGVALKVMFSYVFLFLVFGAVLEATGATRYIIDASHRLLGRTTGGPAKVAVLSSGLMGSLSGSAVANTASTGIFTIPMMRSAGFRAHTAAGLEAAASSGGALVPPVMGAGAYMMLEIVDPPVTYVEILRAALIPAILYYLSLFLIVHFTARRIGSRPVEGAASEEETGSGEADEAKGPEGLLRWEAAIFLGGLGALVALLLAGYSVFRAVTFALAAVLLLGTFHRRTRLSPRRVLEALEKGSRRGVSLIAAAACVGIIIGVVTLTGVGTRLPALILPLAQNHLLLALAAIMVSSIILGMGLPSAVCYLLMATLIGPILGGLGVVPLAAHLFIFYFGMMSMVTPPVALAAYAASSIAGSRLLATSMAAFRFALLGFVLPYLFVLRPELLMLESDGGVATPGSIAIAVLVAVLGVVPLAAAIAGFFRRPLGPATRALFLVGAALTLAPAGGPVIAGMAVSGWNLCGLALSLAAASISGLLGRSPGKAAVG